MSIFITSDTHFGHNKEFLYKPRGFSNIYDHDNQIIYNWNQIVQKNDEVYLLGDVMLGDTSYGLKCLGQLNGNIHIIRGNHDTDRRVELYKSCPNVVEVVEAKRLQYAKYYFFLCHYPVLSANYDTDKPLRARLISLCGHTHTQNPFLDWDKGLIFHCEMDTHSCFPWNLNTIIILMKDRLANTAAITNFEASVPSM